MIQKLFRAASDHIFFVGSALIINIIVMKNADLDEFGLYAFYYTFYLFLLAVHQSIIIDPYSVFSIGELKEKASNYYKYLLKFQSKIFISILLIFFILMLLINIFTNKYLFENIFIFFILFFSFVSLLWKFCRVRLYAQNNETYSVFAGLSYMVFAFLGCYFLYYYDLVSAINAIFVFLFSFLPPLLLGLMFNKKYIDHSEKDFLHGKNYWKKHLKYSKWIFLTAIVIPLYFNSYYWFLGYLSKFEVIAEIRSLLLIVGIFQQFLVSIYLIILKDLSDLLKISNLKKLAKRLIFLYCCGVIMVIVFYLPIIIFSESIISALFSEKYLQIASGLKFCILISALQLAFYILSIALRTIYKTHIIFYSYLAGSIFTITIGFQLVMKIGFMGAIYGLIISELIMVIIMIYYFRGYQKFMVINK